MNTLAGRFRKATALVSRRVADEIIIVPVRSNVGDLDFIYTLNQVGSLIWESIDGQMDIDQIARRVAEKYDVTPEAAENDVLEFLDSLEGAGLVTRSHRANAGED